MIRFLTFLLVEIQGGILSRVIRVLNSLPAFVYPGGNPHRVIRVLTSLSEFVNPESNPAKVIRVLTSFFVLYIQEVLLAR